MKKEMLEKKYNIHENHIVSGRISSGKTKTVMMPILEEVIKNNENFLVVDSREEYVNKYYELAKEKGYNTIVINFKNPSESDGYNPLEYPYNLYAAGNKDKAIENLDLLGNIIFDEDIESDPFWRNSSSSFFTGIALGLFKDADKNEVNLNSINNIFEQASDPKEFTSTVKKYFSLKNRTNEAYVFASGTLSAPGETRASIISVAKQKIKMFVAEENLSNMLAATTIDFNTINKEKTAIFVINKVYNNNLNGLTNIFINQLYSLLIDSKNNNFHFILDNFDLLTSFDNLMNIINYGISNKIYFHIATQNIKSFVKNYGDKIYDIANHVETNEHFENTIDPDNDVVFPKNEIKEIKMFDITKHINKTLSRLINEVLNDDENIVDKSTVDRYAEDKMDNEEIEGLVDRIDARIFLLSRIQYIGDAQNAIINTDKLCCLFNKKLSSVDLNDKFNIVKQYEIEMPNNYARQLVSCKDCGQLFINQKLTWKKPIGFDKYDDYIQVSSAAMADEINSSTKATDFISTNPSIVSNKDGYVFLNILKK